MELVVETYFEAQLKTLKDMEKRKSKIERKK